MQEICPGHALDPSMQDRARREFALLSAGGFLYAAGRVSKMAETLATNPYLILSFGQESRAYAEAVGAKDWNNANRIYLDWCEAHNPVMYLETLRMECMALELNSALAEEVSKTATIYRWMDLAELSSYLKGKFESRIEVDGSRRGCKLFSLWLNEYARVRPARLTVPVDDTIRDVLRPATYTAVPCPVQSIDERIDSRKHLVNADETECRLPDYTRVPKGTCIRVEKHMLDAEPDRQRYYDLIELWEGVVEIRVI